jgi:two-component system response regulator FixJ
MRIEAGPSTVDNAKLVQEVQFHAQSPSTCAESNVQTTAKALVRTVSEPARTALLTGLQIPCVRSRRLAWRDGSVLFMSPLPDQMPPQVIVVDDDDAVRRSLKFALELQGYCVDVCESGEALLACTLPTSGACLVLDERLQGMSGLQALDVLRKRKVNLPAILITSNPQPRLRLAAREAGVPIVEKPLIGDGLVAAIRVALTA